MVEGRNGYTPPADYRAPDFVRQWSDSATRGADRIEQEREQRTRDGERDAAQRAQDGQRALEQSSQDAQRAAGQVARDAQRAAEQLARDEGRAATSTAARASYDLDRSGEGAQRGLAYSHGSANDALLRRRAQPPTQAPSSAPTPHPRRAPSAGQAPVPPPAPQQATPGVHPTPAVPKSRAAKGPAAKNAAHLGQPGLGPGFAVFAGLAAVVSAFLGYWIPVVIAIMFSAGPIKRGFTSGAKGIAVSVLAILLLAAGAGVQILQVLPGASGTDETEAVTESTPVGLEGDPIESGTLPEFTLQAGSPVGGFGEANLDVVLPEGSGQLAVLQVDDKVGGLSASMHSGDQVVEFQYLEGATGGTAQWLINTQAAFEQSLGDDPTSLVVDRITIMSEGEWTAEILPVSVLPPFDVALDGVGPGLYLYTGAGGEASITSSDYGNFAMTVHGSEFDYITAEIPEVQARTWPAGPFVIEVVEANKIDGTPLPWSIQVASP
ncbi:hypothetical protein [Pseudoclavibacter sp. RFBA6]|uniref:hypothetical protein n=1 Tax=Pseudoclavibacter sp. RFBA6 TaxID=2080573 RepID=UPI000CE8C9D7|nr:hypothetical protein [Pseudoclavibacter sp. RFBA6]PPG43106.1 hypothetical protein C5C17_00580 [Pseudoclavibacter sp. RFBA6]